VGGCGVFSFDSWRPEAIPVKDPEQYERLVEAIKQLTAEVKRMIERIREQLREMEKRGLRKTNGPARRRPRDKPRG
jgi:hypothetical protein